MKADQFVIGVDPAGGPDRTAIVIREADGRFRLATEEEVLRLRKHEAWFDMKERLSNEGS